MRAFDDDFVNPISRFGVAADGGEAIRDDADLPVGTVRRRTLLSKRVDFVGSLALMAFAEWAGGVVGEMAGLFEFRRPGRALRGNQNLAIHDGIAPELGE
jgi:hypothetical protein